MMLLLDTPAATRPVFGLNEPPRPREQDWSPADAQMVGLSLFTVWATRTGRVLRDVPIAELSVDELMDFWVDDCLEDQHTTSRTHRFTTRSCR